MSATRDEAKAAMWTAMLDRRGEPEFDKLEAALAAAEQAGWVLVPASEHKRLSDRVAALDEPYVDDRDMWVECYACGGDGRLEDCFEDTCCCLNPPCRWSTCDVCDGKGGWYLDEDE